VFVNVTRRLFFIIKYACPCFSLACDFNKLMQDGFKLIAQRIESRLTFSYEMMVPDMSFKYQFFVFVMKGWTAFLAAGTASYAMGFTCQGFKLLIRLVTQAYPQPPAQRQKRDLFLAIFSGIPGAAFSKDLK